MASGDGDDIKTLSDINKNPDMVSMQKEQNITDLLTDNVIASMFRTQVTQPVEKSPGVLPQKFKFRRLQSEGPKQLTKENLFAGRHDSPLKIQSVVNVDGQTDVDPLSPSQRRGHTSIQLNYPSCTMPSIAEMVGNENSFDKQPGIPQRKGIRKIAGQLRAKVSPETPGSTSVEKVLQNRNVMIGRRALVPFDQISPFCTPDHQPQTHSDQLISSSDQLKSTNHKQTKFSHFSQKPRLASSKIGPIKVEGDSIINDQSYRNVSVSKPGKDFKYFLLLLNIQDTNFFEGY